MFMPPEQRGGEGKRVMNEIHSQKRFMTFKRNNELYMRIDTFKNEVD